MRQPLSKIIRIFKGRLSLSKCVKCNAHTCHVCTIFTYRQRVFRAASLLGKQLPVNTTHKLQFLLERQPSLWNKFHYCNNCNLQCHHRWCFHFHISTNALNLSICLHTNIHNPKCILFFDHDTLIQNLVKDKSKTINLALLSSDFVPFKYEIDIKTIYQSKMLSYPNITL